jgi:hypothetical protein
MTRKRFIQDPETLELIEVTADHQPDSRAGDAALWGDRHYSDTRGPNGEDLSSRAKHRAYLKSTGLTTTDDFKGEWSRAKEARDNYHRNGGTVSKGDIQRAIAQLKGY